MRDHLIRAQVSELELSYLVFSYIKCFDLSLEETDLNNFYMEREWRILGNLEFSLRDVATIYVASEYRQRFERECPEFDGDLVVLQQ